METQERGTRASAVVERDLHFSLERSVRSALHSQAEAADLGQERENFAQCFSLLVSLTENTSAHTCSRPKFFMSPS